MGDITKIFVSATSADLGTCRKSVKDALLTMGMHPVEQTNFPPDYRAIEDLLREKLRDCDAVIHLAGLVYGAEPRNRPDDQSRRSYTQLEFDIAQQLKKPIYVFLAERGFPFDGHEKEDVERSELQLEHRARLRLRDEMRSEIKDRDELDRRVRELQHDVEKLRRQVQKGRQAVWITALVAAILIATGIYFVVSQNAEIKRENTRSRQLVEEMFEMMSDSGPMLGRMSPEVALRRLAAKHGMDISEIREGIELWKKRVEKDPAATTYERYLAALNDDKNPVRAAEMARAAALETEQKLSDIDERDRAKFEEKASREWVLAGRK